jgi:peptide/nickel transport system substrate-binding protein
VVVAVATVAVVGLVGAACSGTSGGTGPATTGTAVGPPQPGGSLTVGISAETDSFNPYVGQWSVPSYEVANAVMEPLTAIDETGVARPYLAESITANGDYTAWTITARPGVTFQNGEPFDATALKKNLDTGRTSGLTAQVFKPITSIDIVSDRAVTVTMAQPWATFPATLAMQPGYMAAPAMLDDPAGANALPIGTGPFTVQRRQRDAFVKTQKNPSYWRKDDQGTQLPYLDEVDFDVIADAGSRGNALSASSADAIDVQTPDAIQSQRDAAAAGSVQILDNSTSETDEIVVALNTTKPPFDDLVARQALAYAVDQDRMSSTAFNGVFPGAWGMFDQGSPYYISKAEAGYPDPDPAKARSLAAQYESTHGQPLEFPVLVPSDPQYLAIGQAFQAELADVGIKVDLQAIEQTQLISSVVATGNYQAAGFLLRSSPTPDQAYAFLATKANPNGLSLNFTRYDDPDLTAAMDRFRAATDPQVRVDAIKTVQQELAKNLQMIFLVHQRGAFVYQNDVHGLHDTTYPGTTTKAFAPYQDTPFYTFAWKAKDS